MQRIGQYLMASALLTAFVLLSDARILAEDQASINKEILAIAKDLEAGKDITSRAKAFRAKVEDLHDVMHAFKPRSKKGIGVGSTGAGLELTIINLSKSASTTVVQKQKQDLLQAGYTVLAINELTFLYPPAKPMGGKTAEDWKKYTEEAKKATLNFIAAVKASEAPKVKAAATALNNACNECHSHFR